MVIFCDGGGRGGKPPCSSALSLLIGEPSFVSAAMICCRPYHVEASEIIYRKTRVYGDYQ